MANRPTTTLIHPVNPRYHGLDALRFGSAMFVLLFHYGFRGAAEGGYTAFALPNLAPVAQYGYLGVEVFFLISGFVITCSTHARSAVGFSRSRFLRLYPAYVICMTITTVVCLCWGAARSQVTPSQYLANLLLFAPTLGEQFVDGVYWSLVLEVVFYSWVAVLVASGLFHSRRMVMVSAWLAISLVVNVSTSSKLLHTVFLSDYASLFATGILIHELVARRAFVQVMPLLALAFAMSIFGVLDRATTIGLLLNVALDKNVVVSILVALHALFIAMVCLPVGRIPALIFAKLGIVSYPLYLLHQEIGYVLLNAFDTGSAAWLTMFLTTTLVLALSFVVALVLEPYARRWFASILSYRSIAKPWQVTTARRVSNPPVLPFSTSRPRPGLAQWRASATR